MGFLKGGVSFRRFRVQGPKPRTFGGEHLDRLREFALGRTRPPSERLDGWAAGTHIRDADFTELKNVYPDHLLWDFWSESNRLPADRLKAYYEADLKALSRDNPSGYPSARQKREARESSRDRLELEARDGRYKKWQLKACLWDAADNAVYFAGSATAADRFTRLFADTFGANLLAQQALAGDLAPVTAGTLALALHAEAKHEQLSAFVPDRGPAERPAWCPLDDRPDWLGNEFLLWLWFHADVHGDTLKLPDGTEATFMFAGGIKVEDPRGQSGRGTLNSESAVRLPEARAAVKAGKLPRKAALTVVRHGEQFTCVLDAETLAVTQGKLPPADESVQSGRDRDVARLQSVRDLAVLVDQMYAAFLARRISGYWSGELKEMQGWLKGGRVRDAA